MRILRFRGVKCFVCGVYLVSVGIGIGNYGVGFIFVFKWEVICENILCNVWYRRDV